MNTKSATPSQAEAQDAAYKWPFTEELVLRGAKALGAAMAGADNWIDDLSASQKALLTGLSRSVLEALAAFIPTSGWRPMSSAPVGDVTACIDIWSGEEDRRLTDCYWGCPEPGQPACWVYEDVAADGYSFGLVTLRVPDPGAWMPAPVKPEGL